MDCACGFENPAGLRFCGACGTGLPIACGACGFGNPPSFKYCGGCGAALAESDKRKAESTRTLNPEPRTYTPKHLADKILTSRAALEGERKQVTVLFADVKGSMELAEQLDPEEWHKILDRFFHILTDGVHRFEGNRSSDAVLGQLIPSTGDTRTLFLLNFRPEYHAEWVTRADYQQLALRPLGPEATAEHEQRRGHEAEVPALGSPRAPAGQVGGLRLLRGHAALGRPPSRRPAGRLARVDGRALGHALGGCIHRGGGDSANAAVDGCARDGCRLCVTVQGGDKATPAAVRVGTVTAMELRNHTGRVLQRVAHGERLVVTRRGKPLAVVQPAREACRRTSKSPSAIIAEGVGLLSGSGSVEKFLAERWAEVERETRRWRRKR